jgi:adenine/guanine phosphoribosyltransferase-like PRPP-binding protein
MMPGEFKPHDFWQEILPPRTIDIGHDFSDFYPATFADGRQLCLPIRQLPGAHHAPASLIVNQASFAVQKALAGDLARLLAPLEPEVVVGLPTLGLSLAADVADALGHSRYVALGTSRKFWYLDELSVPLSSITTPGQRKHLHIDPRMLPLIENRRVALVDDVISTGSSMIAGLQLMTFCGVEPVALGAAMLQTDRWRERLSAIGQQWPDRVAGVFHTPMLSRSSNGRWKPA